MRVWSRCVEIFDHDVHLRVDCGGVGAVCLQAVNELGAEGAKALAPELGKLTQLQTLNLESE